MSQYEKYKSSSSEWIDNIPEPWNLERLKYLALVQPSNVDKKSNDGETPVRLCNYVDVYKNEFIDNSIDFMEATATDNEIQKFIVKEGDVLITKDSETPDDIAIPAYIKTNLENVICGYHLSQIRPNKGNLIGEYLFRLFQVDKFNSQFEVAANGVTRYGLSASVFANALIPLPTIKEQTAIASYLDEKTAQIDKLIADKEKLIELFKEERIAIINNAVSGKGKNWERKKLKYYIEILTDYTANGSFASLAENVIYYDTPNYSRLVRLTDLRLNLQNEGLYVDEHAHNFLKKSALYGGEILLANVGAYAGLACQMPEVDYPATLGPNMYLIKFKPSLLNDYAFLVLNSYAVESQLKLAATSTAQPKLNKDNVKEIIVSIPSVEDQLLILKIIHNEIQKIAKTILKTEKEIELMQEYRSALISEVVTGKIKVV